MADSCTYVLIEQFMDKTKGTFGYHPKIYLEIRLILIFIWQQAHAIDVVLYSYERIKDNNPILAATYKEYFERWFQNHEIIIITTTTIYRLFQIHILMICVGLVDFVTNVRMLDDNSLPIQPRGCMTLTLLHENGQMIKELDFLGIMKIILMGEAGIYVPARCFDGCQIV